MSKNKTEVNRMTLADKIICLRKRKGWSQEELAEKLDVTRQSVSKWESAQSVPDVAKILQMSELFGVTTDYLLKDNIEAPEGITSPQTEQKESARNVEMAEAEEYLSVSRASATKIALGVLLCIISPVVLLLLIGACGAGFITGISEDICVLIGLIVLLFIVGTAVIMFICIGTELSKFDYMEKEPINLSEAAKAYIIAEKEGAEREYAKHNAIGVALCILGAVSTLIGAFTEDEMLLMIGVSGTLLLVAFGVYLFVSAGIPWGAMQKMLEEGEYSRKNKTSDEKLEVISGAYWPLVTLVYLAYSFATFDWHISWVIWPAAAVIFGVIEMILKVSDKNAKDK
jgi:DNA-binding XRE family transcriptional regulator